MAVEFHGKIIHCKSPFFYLSHFPKEFCPITTSELIFLPTRLFSPSCLFLVAMAASIAGIATASIGLYGIVRENRVWLSWYTFFLWPVFALYVAVGYEAFKGTQSNRRARLQRAWNNTYTRDQRLLVQKNVRPFYPLYHSSSIFVRSCVLIDRLIVPLPQIS